MRKVVNELRERNQSYFDGKKMRFMNSSSYFQCLYGQVSGTFITVQSVKSRSQHNYDRNEAESELNKSQKMKLQELVETASLFESTDGSLLPIASIDLESNDSDEDEFFADEEAEKDVTIIAHWN